jgi:putative FmdB family regulatory protein
MTYEYECKNCKSYFEIEQSIRDDALTVCDDCKQPTLQRLISRSTFVLKGGGWAADNYSIKA